MAVSVFDLFKIGIGPSSSHTVGPMRAALMFAQYLDEHGLLDSVSEVRVALYGSLGATGKGHGTDKGVILGLMGYAPDSIDPDHVEALLAELRASGSLRLLHTHPVRFVEKEHITFLRREVMPEHPNGMKFYAVDKENVSIVEKAYLSVGGGFVVSSGTPNSQILHSIDRLPFPFHTGDELLQMCRESGMTIAQLMLENEKAWRSEAAVREELLRIWCVMQGCVERGCKASGELPGPLKVRRRAPELHA